MSQLKGNLLFGQSGGPTSVINASACGVFQEAFKHGCIENIYGAAHGIKGILNEWLYDIRQEDEAEIALLRVTPSSALGSVRYKLADFEKDDKDYVKILEVFKKYNIRYFFYNGGNDSMDTCNKVNKFLKASNYDCRIIGVPKTIDNDLGLTDHCPGFGSAAKYLITSCMELHHDARVYDSGRITILEVMGRNAGWLTASTFVASKLGQGPDLIYVPESVFDLDRFGSDIKRIYAKKKNVIAAVSEGVRDANGKYIAEYGNTSKQKDSFNHIQLGGAATYLASYAKSVVPESTVRPIEFSLLQRCASHIASKTDVDEAYLAGVTAVKSAVGGQSGCMIALIRENGNNEEYKCTMQTVPLEKVANVEKKLPGYYINADANFIENSFLEYIFPLIQGENAPPFVNGVPRFAKLKKIAVK